jgi:hypothetical protein
LRWFSDKKATVTGVPVMLRAVSDSGLSRKEREQSYEEIVNPGWSCISDGLWSNPGYRGRNALNTACA